MGPEPSQCLTRLFQEQKQMENAQKLEGETLIVNEWSKHMSTQEQIILARLVLRFEEDFPKVWESMRMLVGITDKATITRVIPEMKLQQIFNAKTVCKDFYELKSFHYVEDGVVFISYATKEMNVGVHVRDLAEIIERIENIDLERYSHLKVLEGGNLLVPILHPGVSSSFSKSTKSAYYKLNSGYKGKGEILKVNIVSINPLVVKNKTVRRIACGHHRAFDADEDGKMFVVLEEAQTPGERCKVRLFTRKSSRPVATYQPPQQPFQPTDLVLYNLNGERVLLVADGASDKIHVIGFKDKRLMFLRYLALEPCLFSQPCALETDVHNRLWVACRDGKVLAFAPSEDVVSEDVADAKENKPTTNCRPGGFDGCFPLTTAAKKDFFKLI